VRARYSSIRVIGERYAATMGRIDEQGTDDHQAMPFRDADDGAPWFEATIPELGALAVLGRGPPLPGPCRTTRRITGTARTPIG